MNVTTVIAGELERLREGGPLTASRIVTVASDPDSPLHECFTWDDTKAAHEYRLEEARRLLRIRVVGADGKPRPLYVHVAGAGGGEGTYLPISVVVSNPDAFQVALAEAHAALNAAQARVSDLYEAAQARQPKAAVTNRIKKASRSITTADELLVGLRV